MGKKKGKKDDDDKAPPMITLEEVRTRELKYSERIEAFKHCLNYLDDMLLELEKLNEENREFENWLSYLSCDGIPKPYLPADIRLFFEKLRFFEAETIEKNIDWTLAIDERSVLTQDIFRIDKTRRTLKGQMKVNYGSQYDQIIVLALKVLKNIEYYLVDEKMYSQATPRILADIKEENNAISREICGFFDRYCYRVLRSESAYMKDIDPRIAEYFYEGTNFQIHIWTIKHVPILFEFLEDPFMIADLHNLDVKITVPFSVLDHNLTIRGIHLDFDNLSHLAKSFDQKTIIPIESLNASITDLRDCLANEWKMQAELQIEGRRKMLQKRFDYEELKRIIEEEELQKSKDKNKDDKGKDKKKKPPRKLPKEPPILKDDELPDMWNDFLKNEQKEFEDFLNKVYHPELLNLKPYELNLKRFFILGGIYQFDFVNKACHYDFDSFNMTWHANDGILETESKIISLEPAKRLSTKKYSKYFGDGNLGENIFDETNSSSLYVIKMILPEYLCLWGIPMPCHFENEAVEYIDEPEPIEIPTTNRKSFKKGADNRASTPVPISAIPSTTASTLQLKNEDDQVRTTLRVSIHNMNMQTNRQQSWLLRATVMNDIVDFEHLTNILDFDLNVPLSKSELHALQRYCLPKIISSYKFPNEFLAEEKERSAKTKSAGGTLIRRVATQDVDDQSDDASPERGGGDGGGGAKSFSTMNQIHPERLFPRFPETDALNVAGAIGDHIAPKTFYELMKKLDNLKRYYLRRAARTENLPSFKPNLKLILKKPAKLPDAVTPRESSRKSARAMSVVGDSQRLTFGQIKNQITPPLSAQDSIASVVVESPEQDQKLARLTTASVASKAVDKIRETVTYARWTTKYIQNAEFDRQKRTLTIWTDRLGTFGLAYKRYEQFPFRNWSLEPSEENPDSEVVFTLETQYAKVVLFITGEGVRGYVTDLQKKFVRNRPMYLVIEEPLKDFRELRKRFQEKNLNIFTERDASFYIENGYFSQKHLATELHTYCCMCTHAQMMRFFYSEWNRLASRRNMLLRLVHHKESEEYMCTVRITPEESTFVTVKELCSDDLNVFNLGYTLTWRNIDFYPDLNFLITSMYPSAPELRVKDPHLIYFIKAILWEIRPLSFS